MPLAKLKLLAWLAGASRITWGGLAKLPGWLAGASWITWGGLARCSRTLASMTGTSPARKDAASLRAS